MPLVPDHTLEAPLQTEEGTIMHILLATDGSEGAQLAVGRVRTLFPGCSITVVSVVPSLVTGIAGTHGALTGRVIGDNQIADDQADTALAVAMASLGDDPLVNSVKAYGDPGRMIVDMATESKCDVIVSGSHGRNFMERLLLGSVANYLVNHATCPVLVVKGERHD
jgi:nucleotide-binding universal stress UspA family protein